MTQTNKEIVKLPKISSYSREFMIFSMIRIVSTKSKKQQQLYINDVKNFITHQKIKLIDDDYVKYNKYISRDLDGKLSTTKI